MKHKRLDVDFRYLGGNIACLCVNCVDDKKVQNDINNEEAIIIFNSLVGEKDGCITVKTLQQEKQQLKEQELNHKQLKDLEMTQLLNSYQTEKLTKLEEQLKQKDELIEKLVINWNELEKYIDENKMILNNPNIFQFYLVQKDILQRYKGDNNEIHS